MLCYRRQEYGEGYIFSIPLTVLNDNINIIGQRSAGGSVGRLFPREAENLENGLRCAHFSHIKWDGDLPIDAQVTNFSYNVTCTIGGKIQYIENHQVWPLGVGGDISKLRAIRDLILDELRAIGNRALG